MQDGVTGRWKYQDQSGEHVVSECEILLSYYPWWTAAMRLAGHADKISEAACILDWIAVHWAWRVDEHGQPIP